MAVSDLNDSYASGMGMPARGVAAVSVAIRFVFLLLSAVAQPLAALLPYGCGIPLAGNQVRCTWLRHEPLRVVTTLNRALLS